MASRTEYLKGSLLGRSPPDSFHALVVGELVIRWWPSARDTYPLI